MLIRDGHLDNAAYLRKKGCVLLMPICFQNDREKEKVLLTITMLTKKMEPDAVTTFTETWVSKKEDMLPSQDPDRKEAIMIMVETPLGIWHGFQYFTRDENGKIVLGELFPPEKGGVEGTFVFMNHEESEVQCKA